MAFSKSFPKTSGKSSYPVWEEVFLTESEEQLEEAKARDANVKLLKECIEDAKHIISDGKLKPFQTDLVSMAIALFEKRASHVIYHKESRAKEKFDLKNNK